MSEIKDIYERLKQLQESLRKLGPKRRKDPLGLKKITEANELYAQYENYVIFYSTQFEQSLISPKDYQYIQLCITSLEKVYSKIKEYETEDIMADFDLKTAVQLLPMMDGSDDTTERLIDAIEWYDTLIKNSDSQTLINFVLKTRLTHSAKIRLSNSYTTVAALVEDIKKHLLVKMSSTALQKQMLSIKQGGRSIEKYGKELEDLFVNLTISQANGNTAHYEVLKPLNEKQAIHKFADGLRSEKLSTIISARGFTSLKDAIQAAKDEEISMSPSSSQQMLYANRRPKYKSSNYKRPFRTNFENNNNSRPMQNNQYMKKRSTPNSTRTRKTYPMNNSRYQNKGRGNAYNQHYKRVNHYINTAQENNQNTDSHLNQFFRE